MAEESALEALLEQAVEVIPEAVTISNPRMHDNPLIFGNPAFYRMTGYQPEDVLGKNCRFLQGRDTDRDAVSRIQKAIRTGTTCVVELLNYRKDGSSFWNRLSIVPIRDRRGLLTHFAGFQVDISAIREAAHERGQYRALQTTMQSVNDIARGFINQTQSVRRYLEEQGQVAMLQEYDRAVCNTLDRLQVLSMVPAYREREQPGGLVVLDTCAA
jgi:PAS domain S-box-containing protein